MNINTVQVCIRQLLKNDYIKVANIVYSGTVLCRSYEPAVAKKDYVAEFFQGAIGSGMGSALGFIDETNDTLMLDELEKAIELKLYSVHFWIWDVFQLEWNNFRQVT